MGTKRVQIVEACLEHTLELQRNLRKADYAECLAFSDNPDGVITESFLLSDDAWSAFVDGKIAAMWGVTRTTMLGNTAIPWMLSTPEIENVKRFAAVTSKRFIKAMLKKYDMLENYVDARYVLTIRWLRWMGFTVEDPRPFGVKRMPFCRFYIYSEDH